MFATGLMLVNSTGCVDNNKHTSFPFKIKPNISIYDSASQPQTPTDSALAKIFIEFKWSYCDNPFLLGSATGSFIWELKRSADMLRQITLYAAVQLGSQFQTHIFSILVMKHMVRTIWWDWSGAIISKEICYNVSNLLAKFFSCYSAASCKMCGHGKSASLPTSEEVVLSRSALKLPDTELLVKIEVQSTDQIQTQYYVTMASLVTAFTPPGWATCGFEAYGITEQKEVYLKDTWRLDLPEYKPKGDRYGKLTNKNVLNIPQCLIWSDVLDDKYVGMEYDEMLFWLETKHSDKELYQIIAQSRPVQMISY